MGQKNENPFLNILFNIVLPVVILSKLSKPEYLGPVWALVVALAFPIVYGGYDLVARKKWNFPSILGLISVLLTGGLALMKLDGYWFAVKEAAVPSVFGIICLAGIKKRESLFKNFMKKGELLTESEIDELMRDPERGPEMDKLLIRSILWLASSFVLSAILNFGLARYLLVSPTGSEAFNQELARMTALSFPVIMLPCMIVFTISILTFFKGVKSISGIDLLERLNKKS